MAAQVLQLRLPLRAAKQRKRTTAKRIKYRFRITVTEGCRHAGKAIVYTTKAVSEMNARRNVRVKYNRLIGRTSSAPVEMKVEQLD